MTYCAFVQCLGLENQDFVLENSFKKLYLNPDFYTHVSNNFFTTHHALDMAYLVSTWFRLTLRQKRVKSGGHRSSCRWLACKLSITINVSVIIILFIYCAV